MRLTGLQLDEFVQDLKFGVCFFGSGIRDRSWGFGCRGCRLRARIKVSI